MKFTLGTLPERLAVAAVLAATAMHLAGCATASLGRLPPALPSEIAGMDTCAEILQELAMASEFCAYVNDNKGYDDADKTALIATAPVPGVGLVVASRLQPRIDEARSALKSAAVRETQLGREYEERGCPEAVLRSACPPLCRRSAAAAVLTMETGFWGERCVTLNRDERRTHALLLPPAEADED